MNQSQSPHPDRTPPDLRSADPASADHRASKPDRREPSRRAVLGGVAAASAGAFLPAVGSTKADAATVATTAQPGRLRGDREDRIVLITGCSSGFGQLTALSLARSGHTVHASMRHLKGRNAPAARHLQRIAAKEKLDLMVVEIDVRDDRSVRSGVRQVLDRSGGIDVLVNNAGIYYPALLETQTIEQVQTVFETNVFGALRLNRAVLPTMREQADGLVVQMTSGVGRIAFPFQAAYNASKWAMEALAQVSRYELVPSGVDVVIIEPGAYPTDLIDNARRYYRDYLQDLSPTDARRRREYGALANRVLGELTEPSGPDAPDPQEVADAIETLIQTPRGQRPLRTLVGADTELIEPINAVHETNQNQVLRFAGYEDLISIPR